MPVKSHKRYIHYLLENKSLLLAAYLCTMIGVVLTIAMPWPLKYLIDDVLRGESQVTILLGFSPSQKILILAFTMASIAVAAAVALSFDKVLHARLREHFGLRLRDDLIQHLCRMDRNERHKQRSGELNMRVMSDTQQASRLWCKTMPIALKHIGTALFILLVTFTLNIAVGFIALVTAIVLSVVVTYYGPELKQAARLKRDLEGQVSALTQETIKGIEHIQAMNLEQPARKKYITQAAESLRAGVDEVRVAVSLERASQVVSGVGLAAVAGIGAVMVTQGNLSLGTLTVCLTYMTQLMKPIEKINELASTVTRAMARLDKIEKVFASGTATHASEIGATISEIAEIRADAVCFQYEQNETATLNKLSFRFKRGQCIAITGPSGSGKSTLLRVILGLSQVSSGAMFAEDQKYEALDLASLRSNFAVLMQDAHLFSGTFREVLTELNPNVSDARIRQTLFELRLLELIEELPNGLDQVIDEYGDRISGGQKARLLMARALLSDRSVLVFDEPLANIDELSRKIIRDRLVAAKKTALLIVVTHEHSLTEIADQVVDATDWSDNENTAITTRAMEAQYDANAI